MALPAGVARLGSFKGAKGDKGNTGTFAAAHAVQVDPTEPADVFITGPESAREVTFQIPQGERGFPGASDIPTDPAMAAILPAPDSLSYRAVDAVWLSRAEYEGIAASLAAGFAPQPALWAYGHSFVAGTGLTTPDYYVSKVAAATGMNLTNRGQGGTLAEQAAWRMWGGGAAFPAGHTAVVLLQLMMNSMRLHGIDAPTMAGVEWSWRTMVALGSARAMVAHNDATRLTVSGTWATGTDAAYPSGGYRNTSQVGAYIEFTTQTPAKGTHILSLARKVGLAAAQVEVRRMDTNAVIMLWDNVNQAAAEIPDNYAPAVIQLNVPQGTVIRFTNLAGTAAFCGLLEQDVPTARPVIAVKEPLLADWSASTAFPNGSDAAAHAFNAIVDEVAADYPNMIVVDPAPAWRKSNADTLVQADKVHPDVEGNNRLALAVSQATSRWSAKARAGLYDSGLIAALGGNFVPAAGVTVNTFVARKVGGAITIMFTITGSFAAGMTTEHVLGSLSPQWRPYAFYTGPATAGASSSAAAVRTDAVVSVVSTSGVVSLRHDIGAVATTLRFSVTYPAA